MPTLLSEVGSLVSHFLLISDDAFALGSKQESQWLEIFYCLSAHELQVRNLSLNGLRIGCCPCCLASSECLRDADPRQRQCSMVRRKSRRLGKEAVVSRSGYGATAPNAATQIRSHLQHFRLRKQGITAPGPSSGPKMRSRRYPI